jgi:pantothenate kinase
LIGKTTLAARVTQGLNALSSSHHGKTTTFPIASFVPMDGYHYYRTQLDAMPDPENAHGRRGAAFTFDGAAFLSLVKKIRGPLTPTSSTLYAPSFDHAVKDPKENDIPIEPTTRILLFEGNYLSLDKEPWSTVAGLMDELWFVEVDFETARKRLVPRHIKAGIALTEEEADKRVSENDLVNGEEIIRDRLEVQEIVISREDDAWMPDS